MRLADLPIRKKLVVVIMMTSGAVVLLTCVVFFTYEYFTYRQTTVRELSTLGAIIAANSTAALAFDDPGDAGEILSALRAEPQIVAAYLYDKEGKIFSRYTRGAQKDSIPFRENVTGYDFAGRYLEGYQPVIQGNVHLGTLYLRSSMDEMRQRSKLYFLLAAFVAVVSFLLAYFLSSKLQQSVSRPILSLAKTAGTVSEKKDYSVRADKLSNDEIGSLTDAFNNMLAEIQQQTQALNVHRLKLENIVQGMGDAYASLDSRWRYTYVNDKALRLMDMRKDQLIGKTIWEVFPDIRGTIFEASYQKTMKERIPASFETFYASYDMWLEVRVYPDEEGIAIFYTDISKYKKVEEEIVSFNQKLELMVAERTRELEVANRELESFSYSVSHDLRAPLRSVHGYMNIFSEEYAAGLDDEARRLMKIILDNAKKMGQLIDDLLAFSRLGRKELVKTDISMTDLVHGVWEEQKRGEDHRVIDFSLGPLPRAFADSVTMRHVWSNLISNALKYTRNRQDTAIEIGCVQKDGRNVYHIKDNGSGFDMRYYNKLFGVFQRLHSQEEFEGTGVGLAIVQRVIYRHGGEIWAEAKADKGATFFFTLPER
jgi:PAS domain S-box-containing protein